MEEKRRDPAQMIAELTHANSELQERINALETEAAEHQRPLRRALSVTDVLKMKKETITLEGAWNDAFGEPERYGVWFVWGQSGSGKTTFVMQLCKELAKHYTVAYDSLEEGDSLTMKNAIVRNGMTEVKSNFMLLPNESMTNLNERLQRRRSPDVVVIDSYQYTDMSFKDYLKLKEMNPRKLLIFISQADGRTPSGRTARSVMYDASLKIWVEGYRAFSKGRFFGAVGSYTIWEERARQYWGENETK